MDSAQKFKGDKAYIGEKNVAAPHKKPKKRELSELAQRFRLRSQTYERVILTEGGLVRLRIGALVLPT